MKVEKKQAKINFDDKEKLSDFIICFQKRTTIAMSAFFCLIEIFFVLAYLQDSMYHTGCIFFGIPWTILWIVFTLVAFLFKIQVRGTTFDVRTRMGKRFSFTCKDIYRVHCTKEYHIKYGPMFFIKVYSKKGIIEINHSMDGFKKLADYLLMQLNEGNIKRFFISESCEKELKRYANGDIFHTTKRKKK